MSLSDAFLSNGRRIRKDHYIHLVQVAELDGKLDKGEMELLHKAGRRFGLTDVEIDALIDREKDFHYVPPVSLAEKFDELYNMGLMALNDNELSELEEKMLKKYAIAAGFNDEQVEGVIKIVVDGIGRGDDEEALLKEYRSKFLRR